MSVRSGYIILADFTVLLLHRKYLKWYYSHSNDQNHCLGPLSLSDLNVKCKKNEMLKFYTLNFDLSILYRTTWQVAE